MSGKKSGKNNNQNQQQERIKRKCYACGQVYEKDQICPDILKTLARIEKNNIRSNFWGNVFVQCYKKKKNFLQLICEICELTEVFMGNPFYYQGENALKHVREIPVSHNIDLIIEYCSSFLGCSQEKFFVSENKTLNDIYDIINNDIYNNDEYINEINREEEYYQVRMNCIISDFFDYVPEVMVRDYMRYSYSKERRVNLELTFHKELRDGIISYKLYVHLPYLVRNKHCVHMFLNTNSSSPLTIPLCSASKGKLKDLFENTCTINDELIEEVSCTDYKFTLWKKRILTACNNNLVKWKRVKFHRGYVYNTIYDDYDIHFYDIDNNSYFTLVISQNDLGYKFKCKNTEEETRYEAMAKIHQAIYQSWEKCSTLHLTNKMLSATKIKHISHKDVIITSNTLTCKSHSVTAYRGIVHILTPDFIEETYELYVSYCEDCRVYRAFSSDYEELLRHGKPLCKVFKSEKDYNSNKNSFYSYKSQSVLNTMGYTVKANSSLSMTERRNILIKAIHNKLLTVTEIIIFLNWLADTRRGRPGYETAVDKWTSDMLFLKELYKNRKSIKIDSIRL